MTKQKKPTLKEFIKMAKDKGISKEKAISQAASMQDDLRLTPKEKTQLQEQSKKQVKEMNLHLVTDPDLVTLVGAKRFSDTYSGNNKKELLESAYNSSLTKNGNGAMGQIAKKVLANAGTEGSVTYINVIAEAEKIYEGAVKGLNVKDALEILGIPLDKINYEKISEKQLGMGLEDYKKEGGEELYDQFTKGAYIQKTLPKLLEMTNQESLVKYAQTILKQEKPEGGLEQEVREAA